MQVALYGAQMRSRCEARETDGQAQEVLRSPRDLCGTRTADLDDDRQHPAPGSERIRRQRAFDVAAGSADRTGNFCSADFLAPSRRTDTRTARARAELREKVRTFELM